jgi:hypothetical protein
MIAILRFMRNLAPNPPLQRSRKPFGAEAQQ